MESYDFLLVIAIILLSTKILGLLTRRVHLPSVVGALLAGIILGPSMLGLLHETDFLRKSAEIGVIILMFLAGLDTDIKELKKTGFASFVIAILGVGIPLLGGYLTYEFFFPNAYDELHMLKAIFMGVILTATSVSITVETLREMGKLKGKVGTAILGAAILDDILGIIILSVVTGFTDKSVHTSIVLLKILAFFVFIAVVWFLLNKLFMKFIVEWGSKRRVSVCILAFCFILSYISEEFFGVADITGAYFAGLMLCNVLDTKTYVAKKVTVASYLFFSPMFFASIGIDTVITGMTTKLLVFTIVLSVVAILTKVVGCGIGARLCKFERKESLSVGVGMISRGEVALIVAKKGAQANIIDTELFSPIVIMIVVTTLITPLLLKVVMKNKNELQDKKITHAIASK